MLRSPGALCCEGTSGFMQQLLWGCNLRDISHFAWAKLLFPPRWTRQRLFLFYFCFCSNIRQYWLRSIRGTLHNPVVPPRLQKEEIIFRRRRNPRGPVLHQVNSQRDRCLPSSAVSTLQLTPHSLQNKLEFWVRQDTLVPTSDPSKRLLFGQKQIIYHVLFLYLCCAGKGPLSPTYGWLYCALSVLLRSLAAPPGWSSLYSLAVVCVHSTSCSGSISRWLRDKRPLCTTWLLCYPLLSAKCPLTFFPFTTTHTPVCTRSMIQLNLNLHLGIHVLAWLHQVTFGVSCSLSDEISQVRSLLLKYDHRCWFLFSF